MGQIYSISEIGVYVEMMSNEDAREVWRQIMESLKF